MEYILVFFKVTKLKSKLEFFQNKKVFSDCTIPEKNCTIMLISSYISIEISLQIEPNNFEKCSLFQKLLIILRNLEI